MSKSKPSAIVVKPSEEIEKSVVDTLAPLEKLASKLSQPLKPGTLGLITVSLKNLHKVVEALLKAAKEQIKTQTEAAEGAGIRAKVAGRTFTLEKKQSFATKPKDELAEELLKGKGLALQLGMDQTIIYTANQEKLIALKVSGKITQEEYDDLFPVVATSYNAKEE